MVRFSIVAICTCFFLTVTSPVAFSQHSPEGNNQNQCEAFQINVEETIQSIDTDPSLSWLSTTNDGSYCRQFLQNEFDDVYVRCKEALRTSNAWSSHEAMGIDINHNWVLAQCIAAYYNPDRSKVGQAFYNSQGGASLVSRYKTNLMSLSHGWCWGRSTLYEEWTQSAAECESVDQNGQSGRFAYLSAVITLNHNCEQIQTEAEMSVEDKCASKYKVFNTPISLIWEEDYDVDAEAIARKFQFNPHATQEEWMLWKASARAPLLVFDPSHTGKITSGSQLFGTWTFGGKPTNGKIDVSLQSGASTPPAAPWEHGFAPLRSLDANNDAKLSGSELDPLSVWFDHDRDAVSQEGEVISVSKLGIVELAFGPLKTSPESKNGSIRVVAGFTRKLSDGRVVTGDLVDWKTATSAEAIELATSFPPAPKADRAAEYESLSGGSFSRTQSLSITEGSKNSVDGVWKWKITSGDTKSFPSHDGRFIFVKDKNGDIIGQSFGTVTSSSSKSKGNTLLAITQLRGKMNSSKDGIKFNFEAPSSDSRESFVSSAKLSLDGSRLEGQTTSTVMIHSKPTRITYFWEAKRIS